MVPLLSMLGCTSSMEPNPGMYHVARRHLTGIQATEVLVAPGPTTRSSGFATFIGPAGDVEGDGFDGVIVGTFSPYQHDVVYYLPGTETGLDTAQTVAIDSPGGFGPTFGYSLDGGADIDADGYDDVLAGWEEGRVFVFQGSPTGLQISTPDAVDRPAPAMYDGSELGARFVGDIDADGFDDLMLFERGVAIHLHPGSPAGPSGTPTLLPSSPGEWDLISDPTYAESAGDVDGDGAADLLAFGIRASDGLQTTLLYLGSSAGPQASRTLGATPLLSWLGGVGDLNGDGYDDVVVSDTSHEGLQTYEGILRVHFGSEVGPDPIADLELPSPVPEEDYRFGHRLQSAGDVNGDGFDDLLVSSFQDDVWLYPGGPQGPVACAGSPLELKFEPHAGVFGGFSLAHGDIDGDGLDDVVVGAEHSDYVGRLHLFTGLADLPTDCPPAHIHTADTGPTATDDTATHDDDTALSVPGPREEEEEPQRRTECVCASGTGPSSLAGLAVLTLIGLGRRRPQGGADV